MSKGAAIYKRPICRELTLGGQIRLSLNVRRITATMVWRGISVTQRYSVSRKRIVPPIGGMYAKLRTALIEAARSAARTKNTYLSSLYRRIVARRGGNRATVAVAHRILIITYHLLQRKENYHELGSDYYERRKRTQVARQALRRLEALGYKFTVEEQSSESA